LAALGFTTVAFLLTLIPVFLERGAMALYLAAVVMKIRYGGWRAGLITAAFAILGAAWVLPPHYSMRIDGADNQLRFGMFVGLITLITITNRSLENARQRLAQTERRLVASVEAARVAAWEQDMETGTFWCSPNFGLIFGRSGSDAELSYDSFLGFIHPDDQAQARDTMQQAQSHRSEFEIDHRIIRPDGQVRWIHTRGSVHLDDEGKGLRMTGISADVTQAKARTDALQASSAA
jgi:PAS domain S-box-containing protein